LSRIIIAATPMYGHVAPLRIVAADLQRRGHDIIFVTGSIFREAVESDGLRFVPFTGTADYDSTNMSEAFPARVGLTGIADLDFTIRHVFTDAVPEQHKLLQELIGATQEPTILLHDHAFLGAWPSLLAAAGHKAKAVIGFGLAPLTITSIDTAPYGPGLPPDSSPEGRARNAEANRQFKDRVFGGTQAYVTQTMVSLGAREPGFIFDEVVALPDRFLQLSIEGTEYPRSDAPPGLRYIGPLPGKAAHSLLPPWWAEVKEADRVVVVTQGTLANEDLTTLIEPTLVALADLDVLVVAATARDDSVVRDVPANARIGGFVPFDDLLPETTVLVSNGGWGGCQVALANGVPMVLAGESEDKVEVTARTAWTGAAINLATGRPDPGDIRAAVERVLSEESFTQHARRLRDEMAGRDALAEIASLIKELQ
jgi:UDP:flavonoid glycosyltransferase YjiC (YdhE family)